LKFNLYIIIVLSFFSCNKKNSCVKTFIDNETIIEYYVVKDTCNVFENNAHESYFFNDTLTMEGYGNRFVKQGIWEYYNKGKSITKGKFINSNPIGSWEYKNFGEIKWIIVENTDGNYQLSLPKSWKTIKLDANSMDVVNDTILNNFKMKIEISIQKTDIPIDDLFNRISNNIEKAKNYKLKKWVTFDGLNCFLIENKYKSDDASVFNSSEIFIEYDSKIYSISIYKREEANDAFDVIQEQILRSFRINSN